MMDLDFFRLRDMKSRVVFLGGCGFFFFFFGGGGGGF